MQIIVWLAIGCVVLGLLFGGVIWLLKFFADGLNAAANSGKALVKRFLDMLGKQELAYFYPEPADLFHLEAKLSKEDQDKNALKRYLPVIYSPEPLKAAIYREELPKLFWRTTTVPTTVVNIDDVRTLTKLSDVPAYEMLNVVYEEAAPKFPLPAASPPNPVPPPPSWAPWTCNLVDYKISIPYYYGFLSPLNYFVDRSFKRAVEQVNSLSARQSNAMQGATERNTELIKLYEAAAVTYEGAKRKQEAAWSEVQISDKKRIDSFFAKHLKEKKELHSLVLLARQNSSAGLMARVEQSLKLESYPRFIPSDFSIRHDEISRIFILEHEFPDIGSIYWVKSVRLKGGLTQKSATQKETKEASGALYPTLCLRLACEIARLDSDNLVEAIVVNGWANYVEKSTGQVKRAYCASLFATKTQLLSIELSAADPLAAFASLKGIAARSLELTPIAPVLRLNTEDSRFVDAKEILSNLARGENIAAMDWEDFEHLCRELFEKAFAGSGAEVKVTQASRDQGVDAVIFDPDVLRGGKIVVQAKRYTNTVDVSAVRDLYGAIIAEGATKGILVTTSHYGPDAYGFAKDKPITLLNGEELLGLLQQYGYSFKIDLAEAKRLNADKQSS